MKRSGQRKNPIMGQSHFIVAFVKLGFVLGLLASLLALGCTDSGGSSGGGDTCAAGCNPGINLSVSEPSTENSCQAEQDSLQTASPDSTCGHALVYIPDSACSNAGSDLVVYFTLEWIACTLLHPLDPTAALQCVYDNFPHISRTCIDCSLVALTTYGNCSDSATTSDEMDTCLETYLKATEACTP